MSEPRQRSPQHPATERAEDAVGALSATGTSSPTVPELSPRRALVVETDPITLGLCRDVLERSGFVVDAVDSGIAAVVAARKGRPDLIFIDLQLRDVPGSEAIAWLRSNPALRSTPIIVITANAGDDAALAAGPGATLRTPLLPATIRRAIDEVLK
jgi:CheY-like chemotaxis protein